MNPPVCYPGKIPCYWFALSKFKNDNSLVVTNYYSAMHTSFISSFLTNLIRTVGLPTNNYRRSDMSWCTYGCSTRGHQRYQGK